MDKKITLNEFLGADEKLIKLNLYEGDLENLLTYCEKLEGVLSLMFASPKAQNDDKYRFFRTICLIDIEIHKQGTGCQVGTNDCGLLKTLEAFRKRFKQGIEHDPQYKLSDFEWKPF